MKTPAEHEYETKVKRELDRLCESRFSLFLKTVIIFFIACIIYAIIN